MQKRSSLPRRIRQFLRQCRRALSAVAILGLACSPLIASQGMPNGGPADGSPPAEGVLALVVAAMEPIKAFTLLEPDGGSVVRTRLGSGVHLLIFRVTTGRYCLGAVSFGVHTIHLESYGREVCFYPVMGAVGYAGHYFFAPGTRNEVQRFDRLPAFMMLLRKQHPRMAGKRQVVDLLRLRRA